MTRFTPILLFLLACRSNQKAVDNSLIQIPQTRVFVKWDTLNFILEHSSATLVNEKLAMDIVMKEDSLTNFIIGIYQNAQGFDVDIRQGWAVNDCSFVNARFKILNQMIYTDTISYRLNDIVKGGLDLLLLGHRSYLRDEGEMQFRENWDTVHCYGVFGAIVKNNSNQ